MGMSIQEKLALFYHSPSRKKGLSSASDLLKAKMYQRDLTATDEAEYEGLMAGPDVN